MRKKDKNAYTDAALKLLKIKFLSKYIDSSCCLTELSIDPMQYICTYLLHCTHIKYIYI